MPAYALLVKRSFFGPVVLLLALSLLGIGCGDERRGRGPLVTACQNGRTRTCTCPNGTASVQVCMDERYGDCQCGSVPQDGGGDPGDGGPDGGANGEDSGIDGDGGVADLGGPADLGAPDLGGPPDLGVPDLGVRDTGVRDMGVPDTGVPDPLGQPCNVFDDLCGPNAVCTIETEPDTTCQPEGSALLDQPCNRFSNNCASGQGTCVDLGFGGRCYRGCSEAVTCPDAGDVCWLQGAPGSWGVCDTFTECDPVAPSCPSGRTCSIVASDGTCACTAAGTALRGQSCAGNNCAPGQGICLNVGQGATCYQACNPQGGTVCATGTCTPLQGIPWGICF